MAHLAIAPGGDSSFRLTNPQSAILSYRQVGYVVVVNRRSVRSSKCTKTYSIEAHHSVAGAQPEVAVRGLGDGLDRSLLEAFLQVPVFDHILADPL